MVSSSPSRRFRSKTPYRAHVVVLLAGASTVVWLFVSGHPELGEPQVLSARDLTLAGLAGHPFLHRSGWHLGCNLLVLLAAGGLLETRWGAGRFAAFYLAAVAGTSVVTLLSGWAAAGLGAVGGSGPVAYGQSGPALACLGALALQTPDGELWGLTLRHVLWALVFGSAAGLAALDGAEGGGEGLWLAPQVSGVLVGLGFAWAEPRCVEGWHAWRRRRRERRHARVGQIRRQVDELLHKISLYGYDSLTREEMEFLRHASRHFKSH